MRHSKISEPQGSPRGQGPLRMRSCIAPGDAFSLRRRLSTPFSAAPPQPAHCLFPPHVLQFIILVLSGGAAKQPRSRRAVIVLDALGLAALAALFVLWCVRTPGLSVPGGIAAGCSAALSAAVGLRFVPAWVHFWQREGDAPAAVPAAEPAHMGARIFAALLALDLVLLLLTWSVRALAGQPETLAQALEFWRCTDSRHYLDIARDGYIAAGDPDRVVQLVFLPGYPLVVRAVMRLIPSDICAGLLTSALCFAGAGCMIYRLLRLDLPHRDAVRALRFLALAPGCFFFAAPMSESLFLLLTAAALYLARTRRPILGGLCGAYAAFTRSLGLLLFVPLLWELVHDAVQRRRVDTRQVVGALLVPLGFAAYCYINWRVSGNPFQFLIYQREHWNQRTGLFFSTAAYQTDYFLRSLTTGGWRDALGLWLPNLIACFAALGLLAAAAPKLRASQTAWFLAYYIVAVGATWLLSAPRYLLVLLPVPLALAQCTRARTARRVLTALSALASLGYLIAFALRWQVW